MQQGLSVMAISSFGSLLQGSADSLPVGACIEYCNIIKNPAAKVQDYGILQYFGIAMRFASTQEVLENLPVKCRLVSAGMGEQRHPRHSRDQRLTEDLLICVHLQASLLRLACLPRPHCHPPDHRSRRLISCCHSHPQGQLCSPLMWSRPRSLSCAATTCSS